MLDPSEYKTKEEWFAKVRAVWEKTLKDLDKNKEVEEVEEMLPGVDKDKCRDEPILPEHAMWVWSVVLVLSLIIFKLY